MSGFKFFSSFTVLSFLFLLNCPLFSQPAIFDEPLSPRIANYEIQVQLDTKNHLLLGKEKLTWHNLTPDRISELQFHLYLNGFRNTKSTFMIESGGTHRGFKIDDDGWGFIEINKIISASGVDLTNKMEFIQPDNNDSLDLTVFRLPLNEPLLAGRTIELNFEFTAKLPQPPFARSGFKEEYYFAGQWFPKIGVYQNGRWNCHQYHRNSEFFADFGVYEVSITVPAENIVGATGIEVSAAENGDGTKTFRYHAEDVHDFAWTASPNFVEFSETVQDVKVRVLLQKDRRRQGQRHLDAVRIAIEYFQNWYGDYPYPNLTVVDPRRGAMGSSGMEYPTLITAGTFYGMPKGLRMPEMVIIHEFGHNFWYGMVASNEFEEAWLDEGINSFCEAEIIDDYYLPANPMIDLLGLKMTDRQMQRGQFLSFPDGDIVVQNAWDFYSSGSYGINCYMKPALMLKTLQNYLGKEKMQQIMRTYFDRWKFRHPTTEDFIRIANEVSNQDLNWFFDQALYSNATLDYKISNIFCRENKKNKGYDFDLSVSEKDSLDSEVNQDSTALVKTDSLKDSSGTATKIEEPKIYSSGVNVRRLGEFIFPVEIEVIFANGDTIVEHWDGKALWKKFTYEKPTKLISAELDPQRKIPIDINFTNNSKSLESNSKGINKLAARWLFWMQFLLDQPDFLNLFSIFASIN